MIGTLSFMTTLDSTFGLNPSINTQSCIKGLLVIRDFCLWDVWATGPVLKNKVGGPALSPLSSLPKDPQSSCPMSLMLLRPSCLHVFFLILTLLILVLRLVVSSGQFNCSEINELCYSGAHVLVLLDASSQPSTSLAHDKCQEQFEHQFYNGPRPGPGVAPGLPWDGLLESIQASRRAQGSGLANLPKPNAGLTP